MKDFIGFKRVKVIVLVSLLLVLVAATFGETINGYEIKSGVWEGDSLEYLDELIVIGLKKGYSQQSVSDTLDDLKVTIIENFDKLGIGVVEIGEKDDLFTVMGVIEDISSVEFAEPDGIFTTCSTHPNDPYYAGTTPATYGYQWALNNTGQTPPSGSSDADIDAPEAWDYETGDSTTLIAILDSGLPLVNDTLSHEDLNDPNRFFLGPDFTGDGSGVRDESGHGTHVAGIIGAETNNSAGIGGVDWACQILAIQVFNSGGNGNSTALKNGIRSAVDSNAVVINFSGTSSRHYLAVERAVKYADLSGVSLICAAGNDGSSGVGYPALHAEIGTISGYSSGYESVISVGASDHDDDWSSYSSYDADEHYVSVCAPGGYGQPYGNDDIWSTLPGYSVTLNTAGESYGYLAGTSMAAPHVSGLAGLLRARFPSATSHEIREFIEESADDTDISYEKSGHGRINAFYAVAPPATPTGFTISTSAGNHPYIKWNTSHEPDFDYYQVYKKEGVGNWFEFVTVSLDTFYEDTSVDVGNLFDPLVCYKIAAVDVSEQSSSQTIQRCKNASGISKKAMGEDIDDALLPSEFYFHNGFPNPFNPTTTFQYELPKATDVHVRIYGISGNLVWNFEDSEKQAGYYSFKWHGINMFGDSVPAGVYLVSLSTPEFRVVQKVVLIK